MKKSAKATLTRFLKPSSTRSLSSKPARDCERSSAKPTDSRLYSIPVDAKLRDPAPIDLQASPPESSGSKQFQTGTETGCLPVICSPLNGRSNWKEYSKFYLVECPV